MSELKLKIDEASADQLAAAAATGCSASFDALVERFAPRLLRYLCRRLRDLHTAEDLLQDTFLKAYRNLGRYDPSRSFSTWLFTIATRLAASYARSRRGGVPMGGIDPPDRGRPGPMAQAALKEAHANIWARASRELPDGQFAALWLRYTEEMSVREIAAVMGKSPSGVKVLLHRARRRLMRRGAAPAPGAVRPDRANECVV